MDIVLKNRLYAAPYFDLNDPMEGRYLYPPGSSGLDEDIQRIIKGEKEKIKVCSLSKDPENELMWSHYSEGHRGVAIGVKIDSLKYKVRPIEYDGLHKLGMHNMHSDAAIDILSHKLDVWGYEKEVRVFSKGNKTTIDVEVKEVIFGRSTSNQDKGFIKDLVSKVNPNIEFRNAFS
ncbi:DUF2971 domain-containing protein [Thalassotalea psychrophila]|uniref:DUF2971 domain-containing protein n=1 Tax=Thalassotalea psychrophila TaxID=3065647 RepID=A0ABY9TV81_9GAMM|nr:DUF2971 domain-containing protein [Colwelliaceae bacterium SQ149]